MLPPPHSLQTLRTRPCSQMPPPPSCSTYRSPCAHRCHRSSLHRLRRRPCSQMPLPPHSSLHSLRRRPCSKILLEEELVVETSRGRLWHGCRCARRRAGACRPCRRRRRRLHPWAAADRQTGVPPSSRATIHGATPQCSQLTWAAASAFSPQPSPWRPRPRPRPLSPACCAPARACRGLCRRTPCTGCAAARARRCRCRRTQEGCT